MYTAFVQPGADCALTANSAELANDRDFEMLGGTCPVLDRNTLPKRPASSVLAIPSLIPNLIPPPSARADSWQPAISEELYSNFAFDALVGGVPPVPAPTDSLEAYLAAQMPTNYPYPDAVPQADWTAFIHSLE